MTGERMTRFSIPGGLVTPVLAVWISTILVLWAI